MNENNIKLLNGEDIIYEKGTVVLTNQRLIASETASKSMPSAEAFLRDIASFRRVQGGEESKLNRGVNILIVGAVGLAITLIPGLPSWFSAGAFLVGAVAILAGLYFAFASFIRVQPHTIVIFQVPDDDDIPLKFPGWDNPDVEDLTRRFVRAKRGM